jgi:enterochelin esterase-like enzyme
MNRILKAGHLAFLLFFLTFRAICQEGFVKESLKVDSKILGKSVEYSVYLPPDYESSSRSYPVVYLLHGYSDDETAWIQFGEVNKTMDKAILDRTLPPMIIVMPDAGVSWYINNFNASVRYEDFFFQEFIPFIESSYRIRALKEFRGVAGLSMGGYGAFVYAVKHPDKFVASAPLSAAFRNEEEVVVQSQDRWDMIEGPVFGPGLTGKKRITDHWKTNNPFYLVNNSTSEALKSVKYYIDCGDDDFLYKGNSNMHILLRDKNIPHEYRVRDGGHSWIYWRTGILEALKFIGENFHR